MWKCVKYVAGISKTLPFLAPQLSSRVCLIGFESLNVCVCGCGCVFCACDLLCQALEKKFWEVGERWGRGV